MITTDGMSSRGDPTNNSQVLQRTPSASAHGEEYQLPRPSRGRRKRLACRRCQARKIKVWSVFLSSYRLPNTFFLETECENVTVIANTTEIYSVMGFSQDALRVTAQIQTVRMARPRGKDPVSPGGKGLLVFRCFYHLILILDLKIERLCAFMSKTDGFSKFYERGALI